jgi:pilus assembly protein Flp/PilA
VRLPAQETSSRSALEGIILSVPMQEKVNFSPMLQIQLKGGTTMLSHLRKLYGRSIRKVRNNRGQGLVEYALILVLIAIVVMAAVKGIGTNANTQFQKINAELAKP